VAWHNGVEKLNLKAREGRMEKRKPHYSLECIRALIRQGSFRVTRTALSDAVRDFGLVDAGQLSEQLLALTSADFRKFMTTLHDHTLWQDVYHKDIMGVAAHVKIQIAADLTVIISFKKLEV
jgi:motility quorum-sensing regulator/GCU-specific mRNA interferase toxin